MVACSKLNYCATDTLVFAITGVDKDHCEAAPAVDWYPSAEQPVRAVHAAALLGPIQV